MLNIRTSLILKLVLLLLPGVKVLRLLHESRINCVVQVLRVLLVVERVILITLIHMVNGMIQICSRLSKISTIIIALSTQLTHVFLLLFLLEFT